MQQRQRVLLYGRSVILGAVRTSLEADAHLDVIAVAPPTTAQELADLTPDTILFDTDAGCSAAAFAAQRSNPALQLIGIDPANGELVIVWTQTESAQSIADLVNVIRRERQAAAPAGSEREPQEQDRAGGAQ